MKDDSLYDWIADQDCLPQPEPDEPQKLEDAAALRVARGSYANSKLLIEEILGVKL